MRLGFYHDQQAEECALALEAAGVSEIVIHARTKADGYRPPAYWPRIADIRARVKVPLIANGEIWNVQDAVRARQDSGCHDLMIGRGMVTNPSLGLAIKAMDTNASTGEIPWLDMIDYVEHFWKLVQMRIDRRHQAGRLKQWLNFLRKQYPEAEIAYFHLRVANDPIQITRWFDLQKLEYAEA
jgi:tRNA-dihydrouridine synthase C